MKTIYQEAIQSSFTNTLQVLRRDSTFKDYNIFYFKDYPQEPLFLNEITLTPEINYLPFANNSNGLNSIKKCIQTKAAQQKKFALLVDEQTLTANRFELLTKIQQDPILKQIPLFAYVDETFTPDFKLVEKGIDDCFFSLLDWESIQEKIDFWMTYKDQIKEPVEEVLPKKEKIVSTSKRIFDVVGASCILLALSPLLLLIAIAIKIDSKGSIIYKSNRVGTGYRVFPFFKFRSMYQDADERLKQLIYLNQYEGQDEENCFYKFKNDPRVTRVGRIIRKTSLDELPQLFNVLRGEMSLVGNRPLPIYEAELMVRDGWAMRFMAPAGLTGLWQVSKRGKNDMSTSERVALDVEYAQNHSFWYDLKLLFKTLPAMVQEEDV